MIPLSKEFSSTLFGRTFRDAHCQKCGTDYRYVLSCKAEATAWSFILSPTDKAEEVAVKESTEDLSEQLREEVAPVPCPQCGWLQADMVQKLRDGSGAVVALVGLLACLAGVIGLLAVALMAYANWLRLQQATADQMRLTAVVSVCLLLGGVGLIYFSHWRANRWNPNEGDRSERRAIGRKLAVVLGESGPEDFEKLLTVAADEQRCQIQSDHSSQEQFVAGIFATVAILGLGFFLSQTPLLVTALQSLRWPSVTGKLQSAVVQVEKRGKHSYYFPVVAYDYEVQSVAYHGTRYALDKDDSLSHASANVTTQKLLAAPDVLIVYYDPQSPSESLLKPGLPLFKLIAIVISAIVAIGGGAFAIRSYHKSCEPVRVGEIEIPT